MSRGQLYEAFGRGFREPLNDAEYVWLIGKPY